MRVPVRTIRKIHRYLGLIIGIQLLLWTVSGLFFSLNPIEKVRGEHLMAPPPTLSLDDTLLASPARVLQAVEQRFPGAEVLQITLRPLLDRPVYEITLRTNETLRFALADARTGQLRPPITEAEAIAIAQADFTPEAPVAAVEYLTEAPRGSEFRNSPLPVYRVVFDHPTGTRIYVAAENGQITARRNDTWRWFDFFWMFHIMDYRDRDNFNHLLLQGFSLFGLLTVLSGFVLWAVTSPTLRGRRKRKRIRQVVGSPQA
ncbi:PepSY domain-containing protein [Rhodothermus profundi]|uniref:Peptidase propeptide and YPEB domain-containing protein n=1 Tax=Rhodothermus profundi TaxID=633813 RepID=A0A1M6VSW2_9BACT|nr:PepSY domain-containing protein [Rhodothermus profundi]SHK84558.1 Peptidase propeptide and YPEB domain-containing protein [Rhodothermus profundi]